MAADVLYEVADHVATITLNRPEHRNATTIPMVREIVAAIDRADGDDDVRCVVVTGAGRAFCAGADLSSGGETFSDERWSATRGGFRPDRDGGGAVALRIYDSPKPFVAAINGSAVGFGLTMTLPMDVRICAETAKLGFVFARRGIVLDAAAGWFLPRVVPMSWAAEWAYTGRLFDAREALEGGLVRRVVPADEVLATARELAAAIAEASPVSVALTKALLWRGPSLTPRAVNDIDASALRELGRRPDAVEGVTAFLEQRPPRFTSRVSRDMPAAYPWWERDG